MKSPLHILHLEDDPHDAALVQSTLEAGGINCATTRAQNHDDFVAALEHANVPDTRFGSQRIVLSRPATGCTKNVWDRAKEMSVPSADKVSKPKPKL
jgi:hypothetical protein